MSSSHFLSCGNESPAVTAFVSSVPTPSLSACSRWRAIRRPRKGLLGRESIDAATALVIAPTQGIHTFGMQFPIDVIGVAATAGREDPRGGWTAPAGLCVARVRDSRNRRGRGARNGARRRRPPECGVGSAGGSAAAHVTYQVIGIRTRYRTARPSLGPVGTATPWPPRSTSDPAADPTVESGSASPTVPSSSTRISSTPGADGTSPQRLWSAVEGRPAPVGPPPYLSRRRCLCRLRARALVRRPSVFRDPQQHSRVVTPPQHSRPEAALTDSTRAEACVEPLPARRASGWQAPPQPQG